MLRAERQDEAVIVGGRLQFKIERAAEPLPHGQAPRLADPRSKRSMHDHLHSSGFIEEAFKDDLLLSGDHANRGLLRFGIVRNLLRRPFGAVRFRLQPVDQRGVGCTIFRNWPLNRFGNG